MTEAEKEEKKKEDKKRERAEKAAAKAAEKAEMAAVEKAAREAARAAKQAKPEDLNKEAEPPPKATRPAKEADTAAGPRDPDTATDIDPVETLGSHTSTSAGSGKGDAERRAALADTAAFENDLAKALELSTASADSRNFGDGPLAAFPSGQVPAIEEGKPVCKKCLSYVDPCLPGVRVLQKQPPAFQCPACGVKMTLLNRLCGHWPIDEFRELSPEEQTDFFSSCGTSTWDIKKAIEQHLVRRLVNQKVNQVGGEYLPLSVWASKGFDAALIEAECPMEIHPQLGPTYQVKIHSSAEKTIEERVREHMAKILSKDGCKRSASHSPAPPRVAEAGTAETTGDGKTEGTERKRKKRGRSESMSSASSKSSSSKSSTSSKASTKNKKKKGKKESDKKKRKEKKEKEARKKAEKEKKKAKEAAEKAKKEKEELKKKKAKVHGDCSRFITKLAPVISNLREDFDHKSAPLLPDKIKVRGKTVLDDLQKMHDTCSSTLKDPNPSILDFTADDVNAKHKEGFRREQFVSQI